VSSPEPAGKPVSPPVPGGRAGKSKSPAPKGKAVSSPVPAVKAVPNTVPSPAAEEETEKEVDVIQYYVDMSETVQVEAYYDEIIEKQRVILRRYIGKLNSYV